jgi:thiol-disulfide isomerase/thioredoxin
LADEFDPFNQGAQDMMHSIRISFALFVLVSCLATAGPAAAQEQAASSPSGRFAALAALNASYHQQRHDLECRRIADLAALAAKAPGPEADAAYRELFGLAISQNLCPVALAASASCLETPSSGRDTRAMAGLVRALGHTQQGEHDRALVELKVLFQQSPAKGEAAQPPDSDLALSVGEAFLQRLIHDGRYDIARKLCELACEAEAHPTLKDHFEDRMARLNLVGKPAPPVAGTDVDGKPASLADLKGKVVLVDFWATWCPPCVASIPALNALADKYQDQGFAILGINVDAMHEDVKDEKAALQVVRRFLVKHRVTWLNLLNGQGVSDFATAYGVEQIPASFLVGRDGKVVALDQQGDVLEQAVVRALGGPGQSCTK